MRRLEAKFQENVKSIRAWDEQIRNATERMDETVKEVAELEQQQADLEQTLLIIESRHQEMERQLDQLEQSYPSDKRTGLEQIEEDLDGVRSALRSMGSSLNSESRKEEAGSNPLALISLILDANMKTMFAAFGQAEVISKRLQSLDDQRRLRLH